MLISNYILLNEQSFSSPFLPSFAIFFLQKFIFFVPFCQCFGLFHFAKFCFVLFCLFCESFVLFRKSFVLFYKSFFMVLCHKCLDTYQANSFALLWLWLWLRNYSGVWKYIFLCTGACLGNCSQRMPTLIFHYSFDMIFIFDFVEIFSILRQQCWTNIYSHE